MLEVCAASKVLILLTGHIFIYIMCREQRAGYFTSVCSRIVLCVVFCANDAVQSYKGQAVSPLDLLNDSISVSDHGNRSSLKVPQK